MNKMFLQKFTKNVLMVLFLSFMYSMSMFGQADLSIEVSSSSSTGAVGDPVTYTVTVLNDGATAVSGVTVTSKLPVGITPTAPIVPGGTTYDPASGLWNIGNIAAGSATTILQLTGTFAQSGMFYLQAEVTTMNEADSDSTPDNQDYLEDDISSGCASVPFIFQCEEDISMVLEAPAGFSNYQWLNGGVPVGVGQSYTATEVGQYTYTTDINGCPGESCCPVIIERDTCFCRQSIEKTVASTGPYTVGDDVTYDIKVKNIGTMTNTFFSVVDSIPAGFLLSPNDNNTWQQNQAGDVATKLIIGGPVPGDSMTVQIVLQIQPNVTPGNNINVAYLPDCSFEFVNRTEAPVDVEVWDLALIKTTMQADAVHNGQDVTFDISVTNQGDQPVDNIDLIDYIPVGFILNDPMWMAGTNGSTGASASRTLSVANSALPAGGLLPGATTITQVVLQVTSTATVGDHVNYSEISGFTSTAGVDKSDKDRDSTPDVDDTNDVGGTPGVAGQDNEINDDGTNDEDDHDPALVTVASFDLALYKELAVGQSPMIVPGESATFTINIVNQGSVIADNVLITDYIPSDMTLDDATWTAAGVNATKLLTAGSGLPVGGLLPGQTAMVNITLKANNNLASNTELKNWAEISAATDEDGDAVVDVDSTPDGVNTNDLFLEDNYIDGDGMNGGDEDDHDPASLFIQPFDLALHKKLGTGQSSMVNPGDDVTFTITVVNQGMIAATNIEVTDYIPSDMSSTDANWSIVGSTATRTIAGPLAPGASTTIDIVLKVDAGVAANTTIQNWAEISMTSDGNGNPITDIDSTPDGNQANDTYILDDDINGDGKNGGDEDDHDPASVSVQGFDLALIKELGAGQAAMVNPGDDVTFTITVVNQGMISATGIQITDYIPTGMTLNDAAWSGAGSTATRTIAGPLAPGASTTVDIVLKVDAGVSAGSNLQNWSEISAALDGNGDPITDIDSTPDGNQGNDTFVQDNDLDGDGKNGGDEDDHDPASVSVQGFDLALHKKLATGQASMVNPGDDVTFTITVVNQGMIPATLIQLTDYIPTGMTLNDGNWAGAGSTATRTIAGPLAPGASTTVDIVLTVNAGVSAGSDLQNWAEISDARDGNGDAITDVDSTPDGNQANDIYLQDNDIDGDGTNGGDEDDHDPASVYVQGFDLALHKKLGTGQASMVNPGDDVTFTITVINQGMITATDIQISDYIPTGMTLNDGNWSGAGSTATRTIAGPLAPGASTTVDIVLAVDANVSAGSDLENWAEISDAKDGNGDAITDVDSTPDGNPGNDTYILDDDIDGDGKNGGDEDDHDPASVTVQGFDLALHKKLGTGQSNLVIPGEDVTFTITVINQGMITATDIQISDYIPTGMTLNDGNWSGAGSTATRTIAGPLAPGASTTVDIVLAVDANVSAGSDLENWAEISDAKDGNGDAITDVDSTPDGNPANDTYILDDDIDGDGKNGGDEDDHDPASVTVQGFDLALYKELAPGQTTLVAPGDDVTFRISVVNQGMITATAIQITDYIPTDMSLNDGLWASSGSNAVRTIAGPLAPGATTFVDITLTVSGTATAGADLVNWAEISDDKDGNGDPIDDIDSTPNGDQTDDTYLVDNDITGDGTNGGDEDDHDPATVTVQGFDLALYKELGPGQPELVEAGDDVTFKITIVNQGMIAADNIRIHDYIPAEMTLNDGAWTSSGAEAFIDINSGQELPGVGLLPGESYSVSITLTLNAPLASNTIVTNWAEISGAQDTDGNAPLDIDSTPDQTQTNDTYLVDNDIDGDGKNGGDEDDHDPASVIVKPFDLALMKTLAPGQSPMVEAGDDVTFRITVINQGMVAADNILLRDYIPAELTLNDANWTMSGTEATIMLNAGSELPAGGLAAGATITYDITFTVDAPLAANTVVTNWAEISGATDDQGNNQVDIDSTPDNDQGNDTYVTDNDVNGDGKNGEDEDDHDPAQITIEPFDLALIKKLGAGEDNMVAAGDDVTFTITVSNQGMVDAANIQVTDYIPTGMSLNDGDWTDGGTTASIMIPGTLVAGTSISVDITLHMDSALPSNTELINWAEISAATDNDGNPQEDIDSTPDTDQGNDVYTSNDNVSDDGKNGEDEDDHDPESLFVSPFDLALYEVLAPGQPELIEPGDDVTFSITVINQGLVTAQNIVIKDYIPTELTLNDADWTAAVGGTTTYTIAGPLAPGQSETFEITFTADAPLAANTVITNWAEIAMTEDIEGNANPVDIDSTPDMNQANDTYLEDNYVDGDGKNGGDEDDHDPAQVIVEPFDLALIKQLGAGEDNMISTGDDITYTITVINQGAIDAANIEVTDYIPTGMSLNDADWTGAGTSATITLPGILAAGASTTVDVTLHLDAALPSNTELVNWAEISAATDDVGNPQEDIDSTPDGDQGNDTYTENDEVEGDGKNGEDEDDHDPETIIVNPFDLALFEVLAPGQSPTIEPGDDVTFSITVINQGLVTAQNIVIKDYIPTELTLNDADWTAAVGGTTTYTIAGPLAPGQSETFEITFTANAPLAANTVITNWAEIAMTEDIQGNANPVDVDSTPDMDQGNDLYLEDNYVDGDGKNGGDEDDHDPAQVTVETFDLALIKQLASGEDNMISTGDDITYTITVLNQGQIDAGNIEVTDYIPAGMSLNDAAWTDGGSTATMTLPGILLAGEQATYSITLHLDAALPSNTELVNWAEISAATDDVGNPQEDIDSTPDGDLTNDIFNQNDETEGDGKHGEDEDDHDPESIFVNPFDLALYKERASGQTEFVEPGDLITFTITVVNQGLITAQNIEVTDYIPAGTTLEDTDWTAAGANATILIAGPLAPGASITRDITLRLDAPLAANTVVQNWAEISNTEDIEGNVNPVDLDSDPDNTNDDEFLVDNDIDGDGKNGGDEDDHDPAQVIIEPFDLALIKQLGAGEDNMISTGDDITYTITVINQGAIDAANIEVTDYIPTGMSLNDADWTDAGTSATITLPGILAAGASTTVDVTLHLDDALASNTELVNWAEISAATDDVGNPQVDIDSTPDGDQGNDTYTENDEVQGDGKNGEDEDDHDPETIIVNPFDLALFEVLAPGQPELIEPGDDVTFSITVINQGLVTAQNIVIKDYIPTELTLNDADWTAAVGGTTTYTIAGPLAPGQSETFEITFTANAPLAANTVITNWAEIAMTEDIQGNANPVDVDSTPDMDQGNDLYLEDNYVDGDGKNGGDEDDHDPAQVIVEPFDLALNKELAPGQSATVEPGDIVTFRVNVYNQGLIAADNIEVTDYIPNGMVLPAGSAWNTVGTTAVIMLNVGDELPAGGLLPGTSTFVDIELQVVAPLSAYTELVNWAEISSHTDDEGNPQIDLDSTPDNDGDNDEYVQDDDINGDGKNGEDEDDHDPATVTVEAFDLALYKELAPGQSEMVEPGDPVTFRINVINQGDITADNIELTDYIPSGMTLQGGSAWTDNGTTATYTLTAGNELPVTGLLPGQSAFMQITLVVNAPLAANMSLVNWAEISDQTDEVGNPQEDVDSQPDNDPNNDTYVQDNDIDGDGKNGGDEDDHDGAEVFTEVFDLALIKELATGQSSNVNTGDDITYTITVINQGTIAADNIAVIDYIPTGMSLNDADWTGAGTTATITLTGALAPGATTTVDITLHLDAALPGNTDLVNWSEITGATDDMNNPQVDVDSTPDTDPDNDNYTQDNEVEGDGMNGEDEDDHDPATVTVNAFDMALYKELAAGQSASVEPGDDVTYTITVINQGGITAQNIQVTDYIPSGMTLNDADWAAAGANANITLAGPLVAGASMTVDITLKVDNPLPAGTSLVNWAEISMVEDIQGNVNPVDADSTPDNNPDNDTYTSDNDVSGNGNDGEDEDDHDPATVTVEAFDLALYKELAPGQSATVEPGDVVNFTITVINQGTINADNIEISDYIPTGMTLADANWSEAAGIATRTLNIGDELGASGLEAGQTVTVNIALQLASPFTAGTEVINWAEISDATDDMGNDQEDVDSTPDNNPDNDTYIQDNEVDGDGMNGEDEDDHDPASFTVEVFDLAMYKVVAPGQPAFFEPGDLVTYNIVVVNQGMINADNIELTDYIPSGMSLADADWALNGGNAERTLNANDELGADGLVAGTSYTVSITLQLDNPLMGNSSITNWAEISGATDDMDNPQEDIDSTPDNDPTNDTYTTDNDIDGDGDNGGDEDDHDPATISIQVFDLALIEVLAPGQNSNVTPGDDATFKITVFNQGAIAADNIQLVNYVPAGLTLNDADWTMNADGYAYITLSVANGGLTAPLAPGEMTMLEITFSTDANADNCTEITDFAEIVSATDEMGNATDDIDSTPDNNPNNDEYDPSDDNETAESGDVPGEDEDDHDPVMITLVEQIVASADVEICEGEETTLTVTGAQNYLWSPGTGLSNVTGASTVASPDETTIYVVVSDDGAGCTTTDTVLVTVNHSANPDFFAGEVCLGYETQFTDLTVSQMTVTDWLWDFDDNGATSTLQNPGHTFSAPGDYNVKLTVTTIDGCVAHIFETVSVHTEVTAEAGLDMTICAGETAQLSAQGGTLFSWSPAATLDDPTLFNPMATPTVTTTYTVTVSDDFGCSNTDDVTVTVIPLPEITDVVSVEPSYCGANDGSITITATATGGAEYSIDGGATWSASNMFVGLESGSYNVIVRDVTYGCTEEYGGNPIELNMGLEPTILTPIDFLSTCTGDPVPVSITISEPIASYDIDASGGYANVVVNGSTITFDAILNGSYNNYVVTFTGLGGCTVTEEFVLEQTSNPMADFLIIPPSCTNNETVVQFIGDASSGAVLNWDLDGGTIVSSSAATASAPAGALLSVVWSDFGTKIVTLTVDDGGCTDASTETVFILKSPLVDIGEETGVCKGDCVTLSVPGTFMMYQWAPSTGLSSSEGQTVTACPTETTEYTVTVMDNFGCLSTDTILINVFDPTANAGPDVEICMGESTQLLGTGGITYSWWPVTGLNNPNIQNPVATPDITTVYTLTIIDMYGCEDEDEVIVTVNPIPNANAGDDVALCLGESTQLNATGGDNYSWSPSIGLSNPNIANPTASPVTTTTYTVTVTDNTGCSSTDQVTVTVNPVAMADAGMNMSVCEGDDVTLHGTGGGTYVWTASTGENVANIANPTVNPMQTTTYTVVVTNAYGCTDTDMVTITVNDSPIANAGIDAAVCNGGNIQLHATGGVSYVWTASTGENVDNIANPYVSPTVTTVYTVVVANAFGCQDSDSVTISINQANANAGPDVTICNGTNAYLNATGGTSYSWSPSTGLNNSNVANPIASPSSTTTYTVTVTDAFGCTDTDDVTVYINNATANAGPDQTVCLGGTTTLSASGGVSYEWTASTGENVANTANPSVSPIATTVYTVTVTDANGCTDTDNVIVYVNEATANAGPDQTICTGMSTQLHATGGVTYVWTSSNPGEMVANVANPYVSPVVTTTYTVTVTDANGCTDTDTVTITVGEIIADAGDDVYLCNGGTAYLHATGGSTYSWTPAGSLNNPNISSPIANPTVTTTYTVTVTGGNANCMDTDQVTVYVNDITVTASDDVSVCAEQSTQLNATGATTYVWTPSAGLNNPNIANPTATPASTTTYTVTGTDANGCSDTDQVTVTVTNAFADAGDDVTICNGESTTLNAVGGGTYVWTSSNPAEPVQDVANPTVSPTTTTTYMVEVTSTDGCIATDFVVVTVNTVNVTVCEDKVICLGETAQLLAGGGSTYSWTPSATLNDPNISNPVATPTVTTVYTVVVTDADGCTGTETILVTVYDLNLDVSSITPASCGMSNGAASVDATNGSGNYSYEWTGSTSTSSSATGLSAGMYVVTVTDNETGCTDELTVIVPSNDGATIDLSMTMATCDATNGTITVNITGGTGAFDIAWSGTSSGSNTTNNNSHTITGLGAGTYNVSLTDANSCMDMETITVGSNAGNIIVSGSMLTQASCGGGTDGSISINVANYAPNYSVIVDGDIALTDQSTSPVTVDGLSAGTHTVMITDANGCTSTSNVVVTEEAAPVINPNDVTVTQVTCYGDFDGSITSNTALVYSVSQGGTVIGNTPQSNLSAGTYTVTYVDGNCEASMTVVIGSPTALVLTVTSFTNAYGCDGGHITVNTTGGNGGYTYSWTPNVSVTNTASNLEAGTYTVTVEDAQGCTTSLTQVIENTYNCPDIFTDEVLCVTEFPYDLCIPIPLAEIGNYNVYDNAIIQNPDHGCDEDILTIYSYNSVVGQGAAGPYKVEFWTLNGFALETMINNMTELTAWMNEQDPNGNWVLNAANMTISGGDQSATYGMMHLIQQGSWIGSDMLLGYTEVPQGTKLTLVGDGPHVVVIEDPVTCCTDTITVSLCAQGTPSTVDVTTVIETAVELCADDTELMGDITSVTSCDDPANGTLMFNGLSNCVTYTPNNDYVGLDNTCIVLCDDYGVCDTTYFNITVVDTIVTNPCVDFISIESETVILDGGCDDIHATVCIDFDYAELANYTITDNGAGYTNTVTTCDLGTELYFTTSGVHNVVFTENMTGCTDTVQVLVHCYSPDYVNTNVILDARDTLCLDTNELLGSVVSVTNACLDESGTYVNFIVMDDAVCIDYEGMALGTDSGCFVVCDEYGVCDTTYLTVTVIDPNTGGADPVAVNDTTMTAEDQPVTINVLGNDLTQGETPIITIVNQPENGTVEVTDDNMILFTPNSGYCNDDVPEMFDYSLCTVNGCDTATVFVTIECTTMEIFTGFSPNGDGVNDVFMIKGINEFPNNKLVIFNRWGNMVYEKDGYKNTWDGTWNNETTLPDGTYFYCLDTGTGKRYSGYVQIHR